MRTVSADDVAAARPAVESIARRTPVLSSRTISERAGGIVALKAENLQRTGSFKIRGVAAKLAALGDGCAARGGRGVGGQPRPEPRRAARGRAACAARCSCPTTRRSPRSRPRAGRARSSTSAATRSTPAWSSRSSARARAGSRSCTRSTIPTSSPGRARWGSSCSRTCPTWRRSSCRSAAAGCARASRSRSRPRGPRWRWSACRSRRARRIPESLRRGEPMPASSALTIADGIAVKRPGNLTLDLLGRFADGVVVVEEDPVAEAMVVLMERCKLVVEGAGAVGVAALLGGQVAAAPSGTTVAVLSGGNVDPGLLASVARRHETESGRRLVLLTRVPDRPGNLARLLVQVADTRRQHRRRLARARRARPPRPRDRDRARDRDPRPGPRGGGRRRRCATPATRRASSVEQRR